MFHNLQKRNLSQKLILQFQMKINQNLLPNQKKIKNLKLQNLKIKKLKKLQKSQRVPNLKTQRNFKKREPQLKILSLK
jgi:hypothetical protein